MTKVICCISGKGGVGKTLSAINLGLALNQYGKNTAVLDANLTTPNIGIYLGVPKVPRTIHHVLNNKISLDKAIYKHKSGLKVILGDLSIGKLGGLRTERLKNAIVDVEGLLDYLILDGGAGLGKEAFSALEATDQVLIITNPELAAVTDALKTIEVIKKMKKQVLGVVLTRCRNDKIDMGVKEIESLLEYPVIGMIPEDKNVRRASRKGMPLLYNFPESKASKAYKKLGAKILGKRYDDMTPPTKKKENLIQDLLRIFKIK